MAQLSKHAKVAAVRRLEKAIDVYAAQFKNRNDGIFNGIQRAMSYMQDKAAEAFKQRNDAVANDRRQMAYQLELLAIKVCADGDRALADAIKSMREVGLRRHKTGK